MNMGRLVFYIAIFIAMLAFVVGGVRAARRFRDKRRPIQIGMGIALMIAGMVFVAVYLVKSLPLETLRWLVTIVISYAAFAMLRSAARASAAPALGA
jgi:uncharacterized membrane protein YfcA